ncbi:MAG TPA: xanthine dehydrogenase family protein molybdopterin-binding subunit [Burkholderiales bacterium]|nr:xanthine dehydrogenase family protein molybdopterin-binding subunit [Burkholderiales bacterium]
MAERARHSGIGEPVRRKEDRRLVTGQGCFSDDVNLAGQAYAVMLRSPHAHARIERIDSSAALAAPGVLAVLTGADCIAGGLNPIPHRPLPASPPDISVRNSDGSAFWFAPHHVLPADRARYAGEAVAMVVAESVQGARDAAELVRIDYRPLPAVAATAAAVRPDAPRVWDERPSNVCIDADVGDAGATEAAFARAAHTVRLDTWVRRVTGVPMEPRAAVGSYDAATRRFTLFAGSGGVVRQKRELAAILGVEEEAVRVVSRDIGGNFGTRNSFFPEFALVAWAARRLGRPVKWTATREEAFLSDYQGRDLAVTAELALDAEGNFLALRSSNVSNGGAYSASYVPLIKGTAILSNVYRIPAAHVRARAVFSNTPPTAPYRSAGRPEAIFVIERLIDLAAREHGFDRVELRRRNLIAETALPFANPLGLTYDSGAYEKAMDAALALGDWANFPARRAQARRRGRLRGIGIANYIEITSGYQRERADMTLLPDGTVEVVMGTLASGQGHETSFAQLLVDWLGVPFEAVRLVTGDTDRVVEGGGSHSGRSMRMAGIVVGRATEAVLEKGRHIAAHLLEAAESDIEFARPRFRVKGTDRSVGLFEVAAAAAAGDGLPEDLRGPLGATGEVVNPGAGFPYGCQVCEVEVDPETGVVAVVRLAAVDDVGRAINPLILHGQTHGGIAQGLGQALREHCHYDAETGQMLAASFMDYAMPRAGMLGEVVTELAEVPAPGNPLGIRAGGEGGTTPALAVAVNAIVDALAEFGVRHVEMPATPERVWRAIREAAAGRT